MFRTKSLEIAKQISSENNLLYAFCVVDGWFYIGTEAELDQLPVVMAYHGDSHA